MASRNNYTLSLLVKMEDRASGGLKGLGRTLKSLEAINRSVGGSMRGSAREFGRAGAAIRGTASEFERASRTITRASAGMKSSFRDIERMSSKQRGVTGRMIGGQARFFDGLDTAADSWRRQGGSLRVYTDEAVRLLRAQEKFKTFNLGGAADTQAFDAVRKTVSQIRGVSFADTTENLTDLVGALGNLNTAIDALPNASKYQFAFKTIFGDTMDAGAINDQIRASYKFLELTGVAQRGRAAMESQLDNIIKISSSTGGRVSADELLTMARRGGPAIQGLSTQGLRNVSSLIEDMGADQTGTALMTMYQSLVGGRMTQYSARAFQKLGLIDQSKVEYGRGQKLKRVLPGGNLLGALFQEDPLKAADLLKERLKASGVDVNDERALQSATSILFPDRNAFKLMNQFLTQREQVTKEAARMGSAKGQVEIYNQAVDSSLGKLMQFETAVVNFKATAGIPLIETGTKLGTALLPVAEFFSTHPNVTKYGIEMLVAYKAFRAFADTASAVNGMGDLFGRLGGGVSRTGVALDEASTKAGRLKSRLDGIPSTVKTTIAVAATGYALDKIYEMWKASQDKGVANVGANDAQGQAYAAGERLKKLYAAQGKTMPSQFYKTEAIAAAQSLNRGGDVGNLVNHSLKGAAARWLSVFGAHNDPFVGGERGFKEIRNRAPQLADSRTMAELLKVLRGGGMEGVSKYGAGRFERDFLAKAYPDAYKQATQLLSQEMLSLVAPTKLITDTFEMMRGPGERIPQSFARAATAADTLAGKLGGLGTFGPPRPLPGVTNGPAFTPPGQRPFDASSFQKTSAAAQTPAVAPMTARNNESARPIQVTYSPTINATGQTPEQFEQQLAKHSQEMVRLVSYEVGRQRELKG